VYQTYIKYIKIISEYLANNLELNDEQQGFRRGWSCKDAILILKHITKKSTQFHIPEFLSSIDLEKASDRVRLEDVLNIPDKRNLPRNINIIKELYTENQTLVKTESSISREIPIKKGIRQVDSLSLALFTLVMDKIISKIN
jgi:hypothetical protein